MHVGSGGSKSQIIISGNLFSVIFKLLINSNVSNDAFKSKKYFTRKIVRATS